MSYEKEEIFLPVAIKLREGFILVVGGGKTALQKIQSLLQFTRKIKVISTKILKEIEEFGVEFKKDAYNDRYLEDAILVYACTDDKKINQKIAEDARIRGLMVCISDNPVESDFISPAIFRKDYMTVAVTSNARDVKRSIAWRDRIKELDKEEGLP